MVFEVTKHSFMVKPLSTHNLSQTIHSDSELFFWFFIISIIRFSPPYGRIRQRKTGPPKRKRKSTVPYFCATD